MHCQNTCGHSKQTEREDELLCCLISLLVRVSFEFSSDSPAQMHKRWWWWHQHIFAIVIFLTFMKKRIFFWHQLTAVLFCGFVDRSSIWCRGRMRAVTRKNSNSHPFWKRFDEIWWWDLICSRTSLKVQRLVAQKLWFVNFLWSHLIALTLISA